MSAALSISATILTVFTPLIYAQESSRAHWSYRNSLGGGYFKEVSKGKWRELRPQGDSFLFQETARTGSYIELYDSGRGKVWVRLYEKESYWKHPMQTRGNWEKLWKGSWTAFPGVVAKSKPSWKSEDPAHLKFLYLEHDKSPAIFVSRGTYWLNFAHGKEHRFRPVERTDAYLRLRDDVRRMDVRLHFDGTCFWSANGTRWPLLGQGKGQFAMQKYRVK